MPTATTWPQRPERIQPSCHKCNAPMARLARYPEPNEYHCPMADCTEFCKPWRLTAEEDGVHVLEEGGGFLNTAPVKVPTANEMGWV